MEGGRMEAFKTKARVDSNGNLTLAMPPEFRNEDVEVIVVFEPVENQHDASKHADWLSFIDRMAGILVDDPIERPEQPPLQERDGWEV
jgi:hypothetical protein